MTGDSKVLSQTGVARAKSLQTPPISARSARRCRAGIPTMRKLLRPSSRKKAERNNADSLPIRTSVPFTNRGFQPRHLVYPADVDG
jgi:hypothetical protein